MATSGIPLPKYLDDAFTLMEENEPLYPKKLIEELGAHQGENAWAEQNLPHFKGWVGTVDGKTRYSAEMGMYPEDLSEIAYIGLWVARTALSQVIYCAIPSMENGSAKPGESIDLGKKRIKMGECTQEELDGYVVQGWEIMKRMIAECGEYVPKLKANVTHHA